MPAHVADDELTKKAVSAHRQQAKKKKPWSEHRLGTDLNLNDKSAVSVCRQ